MENDGGIDYLNDTFRGLPGYIYIAIISGIILCCITTIILFCCLRKQKKKDIQNSTTSYDNDIEMEQTKNDKEENDDILRVNSMSFDTMTATPMTANGVETPSEFIGVSVNDIATTLPLPSVSPIDNMIPIRTVTPIGDNDMLPPNVIPNVVTDFGPFNKEQTGNNMDGNGEESEDEDDNEFNDMYNHGHQMTADYVETSGM